LVTIETVLMQVLRGNILNERLVLHSAIFVDLQVVVRGSSTVGACILPLLEFEGRGIIIGNWR
jgi:hypothetical protein